MSKIEFQNSIDSKLNNLRILWNNIVIYYRENIFEELNFNAIDLKAIAKFGDINEVIKLSDFVLGAILQVN